MDTKQAGKEMYQWMEDLYPICRSLTGKGLRETLQYLAKLIPGLEIHSVPSGARAFDWTIPDEWNIREAWIKDPDGKKIVDFLDHNLHVVGYSIPVDQRISLGELQKHLYSDSTLKDAIPYITSYYSRTWGFCLSQNLRDSLREGEYHVYVDSDLSPGVMNYGELIIPGETEEELFFSTYVCHPSMANNELSGPVLAAALARWFQSRPKSRYTIRMVFIPETIGSIMYLSRNLKELKDKVKAGFNLTCVGDDRTYSMLRSRFGNSLADRTLETVLSEIYPDFCDYSFLDRGSDERQYCAPGIDLPVVSIMRSKYAEYPEYHTSFDDLDLVSPEGLQGSFEVACQCVELLEKNRYYRLKCLGEPRLGPLGLYPEQSSKETSDSVVPMMNLMTYCDGEHDLLQIIETIKEPPSEILKILDKLLAANILDSSDQPIPMDIKAFEPFQ